MTRTRSLALLALLPLASCMSSSPRRLAPGAGSPQSSFSVVSEATTAPTGASAAAAPGATAQRGYPASMAPEPAREERPGLGTEWGESRASSIQYVDFVRGEARPFSIATLTYNDRQGIEAMARHDLRRAAWFDRPVAVRGGLTVSVVDESGAPLASLGVGGRVYVAGEAGRRYSIRIENHTGRRFEAVASVDGLDVVDGRAAGIDKRGYVLDPWESFTIDGFRKSTSEVAAFRFGAVADSYAARSGPEGDRNVGVIGVAFYQERGAAPWSDDEIERRQEAKPFGDSPFAQPPL